MERARWKIRLCVLVTLVTAIIIGLIYYMQCIRTEKISEGVLISIMSEMEEGLNENGTE